MQDEPRTGKNHPRSLGLQPRNAPIIVASSRRALTLVKVADEFARICQPRLRVYHHECTAPSSLSHQCEYRSRVEQGIGTAHPGIASPTRTNLWP